MREGKTHFVVVYLTGIEEKQAKNLLGVPQAPSGKVKDESKVVWDCVAKWVANDVVGPFAFDTAICFVLCWCLSLHCFSLFWDLFRTVKLL